MFCIPHLLPSQQLPGCELWKWGPGRLSNWSQHTAQKWLALDPVFSDSTILSTLLHRGYPQSCAEMAFLSLVGSTNNHSLPTLGLVSWSLYLFIYSYLDCAWVFLAARWLGCLTRDQTWASCIRRQSLNHWTTREVPPGVSRAVQMDFQPGAASFPKAVKDPVCWGKTVLCRAQQAAGCGPGTYPGCVYLHGNSDRHVVLSGCLGPPAPIFFFFNWRIIALQSFVVFCQTSAWIGHRYAYQPVSHSRPALSCHLVAPCRQHLCTRQGGQKQLRCWERQLKLDWPQRNAGSTTYHLPDVIWSH